MALVLNPHTGHVSPQFHVKFDDFFETVQDKSTDMDAPEPDWKYLSGFAVRKGRPEPAGRGTTNDLIAPRRGPITTHHAHATPNLDTHADLPEEPENPGTIETSDNLQEDPPADNQLAPLMPGLQTAQDVPPARRTRSGRIVRNTPRYDQSISQRNQGLVAWKGLLDHDEREDVPTAESQYAIQKSMENPMAFATTTEPDILYWDQAMKAPDQDKFIEAVRTELDAHEKMGNYEPMTLNEVPAGTRLLDMVWSMRRKRKIKTQEVYKWKARLNVHRGQQVHGVHYWDTYAPVVTWQTMRLFLILSLILGWQSRQLDFVIAYPQAPAKMPLYMRLPQRYRRDGVSQKMHALKLVRNVYGQKQAGRVWNKHMDQGMKEIGFTRSMHVLSRQYNLPRLYQQLHYIWPRQFFDRHSGRRLASMFPSVHR